MSDKDQILGFVTCSDSGNISRSFWFCVVIWFFIRENKKGQKVSAKDHFNVILGKLTNTKLSSFESFFIKLGESVKVKEKKKKW